MDLRSVLHLVAVFQIAWAIVVVLKPSAIVSTTGAVANGAIIAVWASSRTIGLPIGPEAWMPEAVSTVDVAATLMELLLVVSVVIATAWPQIRAEGAPLDREGSRGPVLHSGTQFHYVEQLPANARR